MPMTEAAVHTERSSAGEVLRSLVPHAVLAPSGHNTQPWLFRIADERLELRADRSRALPVVDPDDRALIISCGAALATLRIAARRYGHRPVVTPFPDAGDPDLLAAVELEPGPPAGADELALFDAIAERHTNRRPFEDRALPEELLARLVADADAEGVELCLVTGDARAAVADLVAEGDRAQMSDGGFRRELAAWIRPNTSRSRDGMRGYGFGFGLAMSLLGPLAVRFVDMGASQSDRDRGLAAGAPVLALFATRDDDPAAWLATGQALQRVLLRARAAGVSASFLNQPVEVARLRPRLAEAAGCHDATPQLLIRLGYGPPTRAQPRRSAEEVVVA